MYSHTIGIECDKPGLWVRQVDAADCIRIELDSVPALCDRMLQMAGYKSPELSELILSAKRKSRSCEEHKGWRASIPPVILATALPLLSGRQLVIERTDLVLDGDWIKEWKTWFHTEKICADPEIDAG